MTARLNAVGRTAERLRQGSGNPVRSRFGKDQIAVDQADLRALSLTQARKKTFDRWSHASNTARRAGGCRQEASASSSPFSASS